MGIGKGMTELLLRNGAKVALLDMNEAAGKSFMEDLQKQFGSERTLFLLCDVESEEQFKAALQTTVDTFGGIDILCNNAGILNEELFEKMVSINLVGVIRGTYLALEHMSKLKGGRGGVIVNTASMTGLTPLPSCPAYTASKHGVIGFTRAMAAASAELGYGIRLNSICPSFVQTDLFNKIPDKLGEFCQLANSTQKMVDKLGILNVSDVVEAILELVLDETKNGDALLVMPKGKQFVTFQSPIYNSVSSLG